MMDETASTTNDNTEESVGRRANSSTDVIDAEASNAEFAYPQVPSKKVQHQQAKHEADDYVNNGTNSWEESFNVSISGGENSVPSGSLQTPFLESTRIASTPNDQKNGPSFDEDDEISQVQSGTVDGFNDSKQSRDLNSEGADQCENVAQVDSNSSLNLSPSVSVEPGFENEVFKSLENSKEKIAEIERKSDTMESSGVTSDKSKSLLDNAFLSEATRTVNEEPTDENHTAQDSKPEESREKSEVQDLGVKASSTDPQSLNIKSTSEVGNAAAGVSEPAAVTVEVPQLEFSQPIVGPPALPQTVTELTDHNGVKIYLVGTAHFSLESQKDVAVTIAIAEPNVVMVELCRSRLNILHMDEEAILKEAKDINLAKVRETIRQHGAVQGALYLLFLSTSAHLTRQLGMAPGGEFRRAYNEARNVPGCTVHLGDRPIHVTLQRALGALTLWQKIKLVWHLLTSRESISPEEVERCKQRDLLEELLKEMTGEFPALSRVFVQERDLCLAHSLQIAAAAALDQQRMRQDKKTASVVAVVGIGHVPGMLNYFGKVKESDVREVMILPAPSRSGKFLVGVVKFGLIGLVCFGAYKVLPVPRVGQFFK